MDVPVLYPALSDKYNAKIMQIIKSLPSHYSREKKNILFMFYIHYNTRNVFIIYSREKAQPNQSAMSIPTNRFLQQLHRTLS